MKKFWKRLTSAGLVFCMAAGLTACGGTGKDSNSSVSIDEVEREDLEGVTIRYAQQMMDGAEIQEVYKEIFSEYEKETGVKVEVENVTGDFRVWLTTQHTAQNAPDVVVTNPGYAQEDYQKGYVLDLNEYIDEPNPYNSDKTLRETVREELLKEVENQNAGALPVLASGVLGVQIIYNKTAFEDAGITEIPNTYDEFITACEKLEQTGITPIALANAAEMNCSTQWWLNSFIPQMDEELRTQLDLNGNMTIEKNEFVAGTDKGLIDFTQEPFVSAFEYFKSLIPYCNSDFNSTTEDQQIDMWLSGKAAMALIISVRMRDISTIEDLGFEYGTMNVPALTEDNYSPVTGLHPYNGGNVTDGYIVTNSGDPLKEAAAIDLVKYMLSPGVVQKLAEKTMLIPSTNDVEIDESLDAWIPTEENQLIYANYFNPAIFKDVNTLLVLSGQLYLTDEMELEELLMSLNEEWLASCGKAKQENGWSADNNYGMGTTETE